uniref:Endonuclease/exonuclease/phosphatase family domain-containing protein 1 n=1 Tax=Nothobranchius furzeri TaxID=105023 RepID=A0A8C6LHX9_NOTFU
MGGNLGCHRSIPRDPTDLSGGKRKFSTACNFGPILVNQERLNINTATEEELMTLPGVNRAVAQNIVEYRDCIGGFKKVEDLALVSGIGATKLEAIKLEICVSSRTSSSQHSPSSLRKDPEHQPSTGININTATPAQLMSIRGLTEKIVQNIMSYRVEHGPFRSIEDLVRVPHINSSLLGKIRFQVFVERSRAPSTNTNGGLTTSKSHPSPTSFSLRSEDLDLPPGGPTQIVSVRPNVEPAFGLRDGKPVVRLGTWSLQDCSCEKANNPGVREVVCMTLLENDIKILAVQDLLDREALEKFCVELNQGTLSSVRKWKWPRGLWKSVVSETPTGPSGGSYSGFLWDSSAGIDLKEARIVESTVVSGNRNHSYPPLYLARFSVSGELLCHTPQETEKSERETSLSVCACLFGWLTGTWVPVKLLTAWRRFVQNTLKSNNNIKNQPMRGPVLCFNPLVCPLLTGHCMVVREGLTNPWIPDNWSWGGVASDHCPVVAEFYIAPSFKELSRPSMAAVDRDVQPKHER